jgi:predicted nuclease of predicted toxin-antitoxin system
MSILIDHCVPRRYLRLLRSWGYSANLTTEYIAADAVDSAVLALAQSLDAALLTVDLDFANVVSYPPYQYAGLIVMRLRTSSEAQIDTTLRQMLIDLYRDSLRGKLIVIDADRYRVRR